MSTDVCVAWAGPARCGHPATLVVSDPGGPTALTCCDRHVLATIAAVGPPRADSAPRAVVRAITAATPRHHRAAS